MIMPKKYLPRLRSVRSAQCFPFIEVTWLNGEHGAIDLSGPISTFKFYEPLRNNSELFQTVRLGEFGTDIVWDGDLDMSADTLRRLADEQTGQTMSAEGFRSWRERNAHTLDTAAKALGLSRRMVAYYEQGEKPIPRVVALATRALELA
ncbi:MAG: DUF2442 domain-containing protein [Alphaproteobacteria bacterium]|nr:DUF2442 domain-containing protein [Alphaproteobacteria bacterium]